MERVKKNIFSKFTARMYAGWRNASSKKARKKDPNVRIDAIPVMSAKLSAVGEETVCWRWWIREPMRTTKIIEGMS